MSAPDIDRLAKFAEMMLGQLKSAEVSANAAHIVRSNPEAMLHKVQQGQFRHLISMGERALEPFRSEMAAK